MTPEQKIKQLILLCFVTDDQRIAEIEALSADGVDERYDDLVENNEHWDGLQDVREGQVETGLPCEWSRHYESKSVAARAIDGSWVGWTYWYGGGKHGDPEEIDWIGDAYDLSCVEEEKVVTVQTFSKIAEQPQ